MRKRFVSLAITAVLAVVLCACGAENTAPRQVEMTYFYDSVCAACDPETEFRTLLAQETADLQPYASFSLRCVNMFQYGYEERDKIAAEKGIEDPGKANTMLVIGDNVLLGDAVAPNLRQFYWQAVGLGSSKDVTEYYYRDDCPDCTEIKNELNAYLQTLETPVVHISTQDQQTKNDFRALMEAGKIAKNRYQIPYLVENGVHFSGVAEIRAQIARER